MSFDWVNLETVAVALGIGYLLLAMRQNSLCWYCAFFSTAIYVFIFGDVSLYMESALERLLHGNGDLWLAAVAKGRC